MVLHQEIHPTVEVDPATFKRFLRFPPTRPLEGAMAEAAEWAQAWFRDHGKPWVIALRADESIRGLTAKRWSDDTDLGVIVSSAGPEAEAHAGACFEADEPDRYYFLECYAAAVVDQMLTRVRDAWGETRHYSPGYPEWGIEANPPLLAAINSLVSLPGPLRTLDSGMLVPKKSQIAVFALHSK
jgi:hypothetical protein